MNPKDNIPETVPLSAIRKVIELDAQDARKLRAVAAEMLETLKRGHLYFIQNNKLTADDREMLNEMWAVILKAKAIL